IELIGVGLDCFNARTSLQRVSRIDHSNPISMPEQRQLFVKSLPPVARSAGLPVARAHKCNKAGPRKKE
ncbi:MAG TPA: hypothetical protein VNS62_01775, partial [Candidatus Udaeobacter sp.]|nr:hypothetical protein [Candidatus Udaeobacter sp.]